MTQAVPWERPCAHGSWRGGGASRGALPTGLAHLGPQANVVPRGLAKAGLGGSDFLHFLTYPQMTAAQLTYLPWGSKRWWN